MTFDGRSLIGQLFVSCFPRRQGFGLLIHLLLKFPLLDLQAGEILGDKLLLEDWADGIDVPINHDHQHEHLGYVCDNPCIRHRLLKS
ncbi:hypothetical protein D9M69_494810 [compost metagenome]